MALTQVKTTGLADDAVTLAKQAAGTDGQVITYDASGNPTAVGPGNDGQVLTSTGAGSPPAFETLPTSGATINNATENEIVTVASTTSQLDAEANLTFDGNTLSQTISSDGHGASIKTTGNVYPQVTLGANRSSENASLGYVRAQWNNTDVAAIDFLAGPDTTNKDDGKIAFNTRPSGSGMAQRMLIDDTGNVKITDGDLVIGTSGHGIDFSATAGSGTQELLDDYEEGTWTAGLYHQGADNNSGRYTKIGRMVFAHFRLQAQNAAGNANHQSIATLPFTVKNAYPVGGVARGWQNYNSQGGPLYECSPNTTQVYLYSNTGGNITAADLGTTYITGTVIYETDS